MNKSIKDQVLATLLKNPEKVKLIPNLSNLLSNEEYILYFYIRRFADLGVNLNLDLLDSSIRANALAWLDAKISHKERLGAIVTKEYLASRTSTTITTDAEYSQLLTLLVLKRYTDLINLEVTLNFEALAGEITNDVKVEHGKLLARDIIEILNGSKKYKGELYTNKDIIDFVKKRMNEIMIDDSEVSASSKKVEYRRRVDNAFLKGMDTEETLVNLNLSGNITLPSINLTHHISLLGLSKVGKTTFALGEIIYPALALGYNVEYDSCEMTDIVIYSKLIAKHFYVKTGKKLKIKDIKTVLFTSTFLRDYNVSLKELLEEHKVRKRIIAGEASPEEAKLDDDIYRSFVKNQLHFKNNMKLSEEVRAVIKMSYQELVYSGDFGNLIINQESDKEVRPFDIEDIEERTVERLKRNNTHLLIRDHAGHYQSSKNMDNRLLLERVYKSGEVIANNKEHPCTVVTVNHIDTSATKTLEKSEDSSVSINARAFGTTQSQKSCDCEIVLYATKEDQQKGLVTIEFQFVRHAQIPPPLQLAADLQVADFRVIMENTKPKYLTKNDMESIKEIF